MLLYKQEKQELTKIITKQEQLKIILGDVITKSDVHQAIYFDKKLLGVKRIDREKTEQVFVIDYNILYEVADEMCEELKIGNEEIIYSTENKSYAIYFRGNLKLNKQREYKMGISNRPTHSYESVSNDFDSDNFDFIPSIVITNGYDYNNDITVYLIAVNENGIENGFIVLDLKKINEKTKSKLLKASSSEAKKQILNIYFKTEITVSFKKEFEKFTEDEKKLKKITASKNKLIAVAFNIYGNLKNEQTLLSDKKKTRDLSHFFNQCDFYFKENQTFYSLLLFIGRNSINFKFGTSKFHLFEDALHRKTALKNLIERILEGKNTDKKELNKYINAQVSALNKIKPHIV